MKLVIKRIFLRDYCTMGCLQVIFSGDYDSEYIDASALKPHPKAGKWMTLCDTLEPRAIAWVSKPLIGQYRGVHIPGKTAIPEGTYQIALLNNKTYKRKMPTLLRVPEFKRIVMRTGKTTEQSRGDILVGKAISVVPKDSTQGMHTEVPDTPADYVLDNSRQSFNLLYKLIEEAIDYGEDVTVEVRSTKGWTY